MCNHGCEILFYHLIPESQANTFTPSGMKIMRMVQLKSNQIYNWHSQTVLDNTSQKQRLKTPSVYIDIISIT